MVRDREQRRPQRLSEAIRRDTERKWEEDPYLGSADGGGVCGDDWDQDGHPQHDDGDAIA